MSDESVGTVQLEEPVDADDERRSPFLKRNSGSMNISSVSLSYLYSRNLIASTGVLGIIETGGFLNLVT